MFILYANKTQLTVRKREQLTSGSVNIYRVRFEFSGDWEGMAKTAVFKAGNKVVSVLLPESGEVIIPWEVLASQGRELFTGVYGTIGGDVVLPTVWASLGTILEGVTPGSEAQEPTLGVYEQILDELANKADGLEYNGLNLKLKAGDKPLSTVQITGGSGEGGAVYQFGHGLKLTGNTVSVETTDDFKGDNTLPMTAAGVQATVGNIEALLGTI